MSDSLNKAGITTDLFSTTDLELMEEFANFDLEENDKQYLINLEDLFDIWNAKKVINGLDKNGDDRQYLLTLVSDYHIIANSTIGLEVIRGKIPIPNIIYSVNDKLNQPYTILIRLKKYDKDNNPITIEIRPSIFGISNLFSDDVIRIITKISEIKYFLIMVKTNKFITKLTKIDYLKQYKVVDVSYHSSWLNKVKQYLKK